MSCKTYEVANVVTVVIIWVQTDNGLSGNFWNYGSEVFSEYMENLNPPFDVMCNAFPTVVSLFFQMSNIDMSKSDLIIK